MINKYRRTHIPVNKNTPVTILIGLGTIFLDFNRAKNPIGGNTSNNVSTNPGESYHLSVLLVFELLIIVLYVIKGYCFIIY